MWNRKKFCFITLPVTLVLLLSILLAPGCSQTKDDSDSQTGAETTESQETENTIPQITDNTIFPGQQKERNREKTTGFPTIDMDELATILGIEPGELETAFSQARSETFGDIRFPPAGNMTDRQPPEDFSERQPPEGMINGQTGMPEDMLASVAEILNIDLQELENAITQASN